MEKLRQIYDRVNQSGSGLVSNLAKAGLELGSKGYLFIGSFTRILFHTKI